MIQKTSLEAFKVLTPELGDMQMMVFRCLKNHPNSSNSDICRIMHKSINCITPRMKELRDKGLVVQSGTKKDRITNKRVICWTAL